MTQGHIYLPYAETHAFSRLVTDYLEQNPQLTGFYQFGTDPNGLQQAIEARQQFPVNRQALSDTLRKQYAGLALNETVRQNLELLTNENTFTVCTAHQPNLLTGYLYFPYKILHAIKLADELNKLHPDKHFVPVYYMGSEDNDLDELGQFRYNNEKYVWDGSGQQGAVGRMSTQGLKPLLQELFRKLGPPGPHCDELKNLLEEAYTGQRTISAATRYLVNALFGRYGLLVLDPDDALLKQQFIHIMQDDLLSHKPFELATDQAGRLSEHYKVQAYPRPVNLFYLNDDLRERIEEHDGQWTVVGTNIRFDKAALLTELETHPERFSPNVILRGLYQETILPNVAFIGGGAEVAYWLQLKEIFSTYRVFYPSIHLRQSVLWVRPQDKKLQDLLGLTTADMFLSENDLVHRYVLQNGKDRWQTDEEMSAIAAALMALKDKATTLDPTLRASAEAALARIRYQVELLEKKMLRAEKRKMQTELLKISKLKAALFPNGGLQERIENFIEYYPYLGPTFFDTLLNSFQPFRHQFLVIEQSES